MLCVIAPRGAWDSLGAALVWWLRSLFCSGPSTSDLIGVALAISGDHRLTGFSFPVSCFSLTVCCSCCGGVLAGERCKDSFLHHVCAVIFRREGKLNAERWALRVRYDCPGCLIFFAHILLFMFSMAQMRTKIFFLQVFFCLVV